MNFIPSTPTTFVTANSYLSLAEANEIFTADSQAAIWAALTDSVKQIVLIESALLIDSYYAYKGEKTDPKQLLQFPRNGDTTIPTAIKFATVIMAKLDLASGSGGGGVISGSVKSERVGKIKVEYYGGSTSSGDIAVDPVVRQLKEYLRMFRRRTARVVL